MSAKDTYETLYNNMKHTFTVASEDGDYTLGAYMRKRANEKEKTTSDAVVVRDSDSEPFFRAIVSTLNEKLTVTKEPEPEKAVKSFPLRSSLSSMLCALVLCGAVLFAGIALKNGAGAADSGIYAASATDVTVEDTVSEAV